MAAGAVEVGVGVTAGGREIGMPVEPGRAPGGAPSRNGSRAAWVAAVVCLLPGAARASDTFFFDWIVGAGGVVVADADDRFFVRRHFLNASAQNAAWSTGDSELVFEVGADHTFTVPGADLGPYASGLSANFAWSILRLRIGQRLALEDANATPGAAQYVRRLLLEGGLAQIADVTSDGTRLYYDPTAPENAYLGGQTYPLTGGGAIAPYSATAPPVPSLGPVGIAALGSLLLGIGAIAGRGRRAAGVVHRRT